MTNASFTLGSTTTAPGWPPTGRDSRTERVEAERMLTLFDNRFAAKTNPWSGAHASETG